MAGGGNEGKASGHVRSASGQTQRVNQGKTRADRAYKRTGGVVRSAAPRDAAMAEVVTNVAALQARLEEKANHDYVSSMF